MPTRIHFGRFVDIINWRDPNCSTDLIRPLLDPLDGEPDIDLLVRPGLPDLEDEGGRLEDLLHLPPLFHQDVVVAHGLLGAVQQPGDPEQAEDNVL